MYSNDSNATAATNMILAGLNNTLISIWIVNQPHSITKCCITSPIGKYHLLRAVRKRDFLAAIYVVMLNLFVWEVK